MFGLIVIAGLLGAAPKQAPPAVGESWAVVLATRNTYEQARAELSSLTAAASRWVKAAKDYPQVIESSKVPGFKPGFHVVVLGYCGQKDLALDATRFVQLGAPGAYARRVSKTMPLDTCPLVAGQKTSLTGLFRLDSEQKLAGNEALRLVVLRGGERKKALCVVRDAAVQLWRAGELVEERHYEASCDGPCTKAEQREGGTALEELQAQIDRGEATESQLDYNFTECLRYEPQLLHKWDVGGPLVLMKLPSGGPHAETVNTYELVGYGCDGLETFEFEPMGEYGLDLDPDPQVKVTNPAKRAFTILSKGQPKAKVEWSTERCTWVALPITSP